ncbi:MAG TPA: 30S ribosome-binding factor RbfA [Candidatus Hydrogenedentes bacterium]|nr:30S ribosome-binding factor RbfA [Candidatus Hydrogenedentota bacterium]HOL77457.1 30S ribosome-binding factor RbfA [Candidatus Hydrogenedentota bacterium]HPO86296.1 30S ribosome-binding factor RbfA [Candidatus Hydrogenedentota bacterium]
MKQEGRGKRVAEEIRKKIADLLLNGVKDPRIGFVSVMEVRMSPDLRYATVYVSLYGSEKERKSSLIGLQQCAGWIRREIARSIRLRYVPEIRFEADTTLDKAFRLEEVFKEIRAEQDDQKQSDSSDQER